jgi:aryl-phospho-beta-D-glucosidase BglC (GH1 family)
LLFEGIYSMKPFSLFLAIAALLTAISTLAQAASSAENKPAHWWNAAYLTQPLNSPDAHKLPLISVNGNRFVDPAGKPILFLGVNIADPDKIESQGHWNREFFVKVKATGATIVRIPVHPAAWRSRGVANYLALLDQAVQWSTELGLYVDIDWHSIGNLKQGLFQDPMYETSLPETYNFWRVVASHFRGHHTVASFELFNEPTVFNGQLGTTSWEEWREINEQMITIIRANGSESIPLVAGFDWAYDLTPLRISPIRAEHIGYVTHPYPFKRMPPWTPKWEEDFGFAADRYPIVATELGFESDAKTDQAARELNRKYGEEIVNYFEQRGISWIVWCFDPEWGPRMITSWDADQLTDGGKFFTNQMRAKAAPASPPAGK